MLFRFAYLTVTHAFAALRLLPMSDRDKDAEILALRHQLTVLQRQLAEPRPRFTPVDRAFLAALLAPLPRAALCRLRLLISPDTVLRWHRNLIQHHHAAVCRPRRPGRPRTARSIRTLVLRLARENPHWGYHRIHGELATLGIKVAASTVWEVLKAEGVDPAPQRSTTWADFLRSQADALLAMDFVETVTPAGQRQYVLAAIEHATRRVRVLGTTAHPTYAWTTQAIKNLAMDLEDAGTAVTFLIRDRDAKYPALIDAVLADAGIRTVLTGVRIPTSSPSASSVPTAVPTSAQRSKPHSTPTTRLNVSPGNVKPWNRPSRPSNSARAASSGPSPRTWAATGPVRSPTRKTRGRSATTSAGSTPPWAGSARPCPNNWPGSKPPNSQPSATTLPCSTRSHTWT